MSLITIAGIEMPLRQTARGPVIASDWPQLEPLKWVVNIAVQEKLAEFRPVLERGELLEYDGLRAEPVGNGEYKLSGSFFETTMTLPAATILEIIDTLHGMRIPPKPRVIPEPKEPDPPPPPRVAPPRPAGLGTSWAELERRAAELDAMVTRERTDEHLAEEARVRCWLLNDLQDSGLFDRAEYLPDDEELPVLREYRAAAKQLAIYLESEERAEFNPDAPPTLMLGAPVSIDWYRRPSPAPKHAPPLRWLAFLEASMGGIAEAGGDRGWMSLVAGPGGRWTVYWRYDDALHPCIYAATP